ncbi:magnesium and cobalt transport protein CorA [Phytomonospora sp. NPDC050363]|uniref:magnesium and cobalt transport protein CorA n=1 Tax=Phytomonospora sp. NPDC050363 TaxID=3155642 RepID=UPI0033D06B3E
MAASKAARCAVIHEDGVEDLGEDLDAAIARTRQLGGPAYLWVDTDEPPEALLRQSAAVLGLHPLAVEDAVGAHQRAKVDEYGEQILVVLKTVEYIASTAQIELGEIDLFVGPDFILSVRHGATEVFETAHRRAMSSPKLRSHGPGGIAYVIADAVVDEYEVIAGIVGREISVLERRVFSPRRDNVADAIYFLKREVIEFRDAVEPVPGVLSELISRREQLPDSVRPWLRDVEDHAMRVNTQVASFNDLLTSVLTAHQAKVGTEQNNDMRRISAWAAVIAVPTAIAGIYGMNFRRMPELSWSFGYPGVILVMASLCGILWWLFRRNGWL